MIRCIDMHSTRMFADDTKTFRMDGLHMFGFGVEAVTSATDDSAARTIRR